VITPRDYRTKKLFNQPKYKGCVFKVQLVISLTGMWYVSLATSSYFSLSAGEIVLATFPNYGVDHDSKIWRKSLEQALTSLGLPTLLILAARIAQ
jgi:hypothetical protein